MIRAALVLHLFYPDVALDLIERVSRLDTPFDLFVTHVGPLDPAVVAALDRLPRLVETRDVPNCGWDIGPLFRILPRLATLQYDVVGKLHTKGGRSASSVAWRRQAYDGLIASDGLVAEIFARFTDNPGLALVGPKLLYKSVATHMFANFEHLSDLALRLTAPACPPSDWSFFAGTFFWARRRLLERVAALARFDGATDAERRDGTSAHAIERLFGLASIVCGGTVGLVAQGQLHLRPATAPSPPEPILETLLSPAFAAEPVEPATAALIRRSNPLFHYIRHGHGDDALDPSLYVSTAWYRRSNPGSVAPGAHPLRDHISSHGQQAGCATGPPGYHNPLLDYIRHGRDVDALDPNFFFSSSWYNHTYADVHASGMNPLEHFIRHGAGEGRLPGPLGHHNPLLDYIQHGRDADALDPNPYFNSRWYLSAHRDLLAAGVHPLQHYIEFGDKEGRSAGPSFSADFYRRTYPNADTAAGGALRHFLQVGVAEGRTAAPPKVAVAGDTGERPRRFYPDFDLERESAFLRGLSERQAGMDAPRSSVSVIMAAFNGAERIGAAIRSVLAQTYRRFELLIIDDGSTDDTAEIATAFGDPRVRLIRSAHRGVSAARNLGLGAATGDVVAYLDCDNRWKPWFLDVMTAWMAAETLEIGYCAIALRDEHNALKGYRGDDFDWAACLAENYVDLNGLCHRRVLAEQLGGFDCGLRRMVDWDLILRFGRDRRVGYAPFVGCEYFDGKATGTRITQREPAAFQAVVRAKHAQGIAAGGGLAARVRLAFAIKVAAPREERLAWGDYHFADSLKAAIERLGHSVRIDFRDEWYGHRLTSEDVVIVLRGLIPYEPRPGQMCFVWTISHPDQVDWAEYDRYSRVYAASASYAALLGIVVRAPVSAMLQATDPARFHPRDDVPPGPPVMFVGNSRGVDRDIVRWAIEAGHPPVIYGDGWAGRVPGGLVKGTNVDNRELGQVYAAARAVLNDHWPSMRAFGLLTNRLFDVVASGGRAVSDPVPSMISVFGNAILQVDGAGELARSLDTLLDTPRDRDRERAAAARIHALHSFDARARTFVGDALSLLGLDAPAGAPQTVADTRLRVHLVAQHAPHGPQSSAFIRLVAPLTADGVAHRIRLSISPAEQEVPECDICIVQRTALPDIAAAAALVRRVSGLGAALVTDVDDAFSLLGTDHPEHASYIPRVAALSYLMAASAETWFSTTELARSYRRRPGRRTVIIPNGLDPRFWRDWRKPHVPAFTSDRVRMLYMGTQTHGADFGFIRPALERLHQEHGDAFMLTLIGIDPETAPASWLQRLAPPADAISYPRFARWLRQQGPFDLGLAPLTGTPFNRCKSDIKCLDYAALGVLPVLSDAPSYRTDPRLREFALFARDEEGWLAAFRNVLSDRDGAARRAAALQAYVWEHRSVSGIAAGMLERLQGLVS